MRGSDTTSSDAGHGASVEHGTIGDSSFVWVLVHSRGGVVCVHRLHVWR